MTEIEQTLTHIGVFRRLTPCKRGAIAWHPARSAVGAMRGVCLAVVLALGAASSAILGSPVETPPPAPSSGAPSTSAAPPGSSTRKPDARRPRAHFFVGEVVEIPAGQAKFSVRETLRDGPPKVTFFLVSAQTTVSRGKERAGFEDLKVNDHVTIKYADSASPEKEAISVRITPSARPKPATPPPPPAAPPH